MKHAAEATAECVALVRLAVEWRAAHLAAIRNPDDRPARLPHPDWEIWYGRAELAVREMGAPKL